MSVLLTGASGFVGGAVLKNLQYKDFVVRPVFRTQELSFLSCHPALPAVIQPSLTATTHWSAALSGVDVVVHAAARVHVMQDSAFDPLMAFRQVNVEGTLNLAHQASQAGVRRFVFISTIKVNGENTRTGKPFIEESTPFPEDPYAISKHEAEQGLHEISASTGMEIVIIRPPLVYGPGVKGNMLSLMKLAKSGLPLPLGLIQNQRSMVYLGNLVDLIIKCIDSPAAANQTFLVSDARDLSTPELIRLLRSEMGLPHRMVPVPPLVLSTVGRLIGKREMVDRLCGSLQVDRGKARRLLNWEPPFSVEQGISEMVKTFLNTR